MPEPRQTAPRPAADPHRIARASIAVAVAVLALKALAWWLTGSVALLSDALESTVNVAAALAAYLAIRTAALPADRNHPYGHHKAEYLSAVFEGAMIVLAAIAVFGAAWDAFQTPRALTAPLEGLAVNAAAGVLNLLWGLHLIRQGRVQRSPALAADGRHLLADVMSSVGVLAGLGLAIATELPVLDPLLAAAVAVYILWSGWHLMRESVGGLMDEAVPEAIASDIAAIISAHGDGAFEAHDIRTRRAAQAIFVEFHLVVPSSMTVGAAHEICDRIETALKSQLPGCIPTIHVEPEHKAKRVGAIAMG